MILSIRLGIKKHADFLYTKFIFFISEKLSSSYTITNTINYYYIWNINIENYTDKRINYLVLITFITENIFHLMNHIILDSSADFRLY